MLYCINRLIYEFWTRTVGWEFDRSHGAGTSSPSHIYIYIYIYIQVCILYMSSVIGHIYHIYIQQECRSVLVKLHPITFYRIVFLGSARFLGWLPFFVFFGLPNVSCSMVNNLILGCLWPFLFVLNNILILCIWRSAISHLPGCFCPWTFFQNIGFNMVPSVPFMSHLATQLGYSAGEFQALQMIVLVALGVVDYLIASCMLVHLLEIDF